MLAARLIIIFVEFISVFFCDTKILRIILSIKQNFSIFVLIKSIDMNFQQMEYIVAVDKYRHFVKAADACNVTQSTLSSMIQKLEDELNVQIFDRASHPVRPTPVGEKIIAQAKVVLFNASQLKEMVEEEKTSDTGEIRIGVLSTVAPYILPKLIKDMRLNHKGITLRVIEAQLGNILPKLKNAEIDMALLTTPLENNGLLEIPVYYEKFTAYVCPDEPISKLAAIEAGQLPSKHLWVLQEGHCFRHQVLNICNRKSDYAAIYEAGSIDTLVKIVDENGGYTIIPEMQVGMLSDSQKSKVRPIINPEPVREISLVIREDFVKERLLNIVASSIRSFIPEKMIDPRLKKFAIKL